MINVFESNVGPEEIEEIKNSIQSHWMGMGNKVKLFETEFKNRLKLNDFVMLDSGSNALYLAIKLLELPINSEVILPSFTWVACAQAIVLNNLIPIFVDVNLDSYNICHETIEPYVTNKTSAIMVVHYAGLPVDIEGIKQFNLPIIEDAAHAVDSMIDGKFCGSLGDIAIYSFDAVKNLATPEGGGLTSNNSELVEYARSIRYCGIQKSGFSNTKHTRWWEHNIIDISPKFIPNDISAACGLAQLKKLNKLQDRRREIWNRYQNELNCDWIKHPQNPTDSQQHSYFTYLIQVKTNRDALSQYLLQQGIYTTLRYHPLHLNPIYREQYKRLPNCEYLNEHGLNIPLHPALSDTDIDKIIESIKNFTL